MNHNKTGSSQKEHIGATQRETETGREGYGRDRNISISVQSKCATPFHNDIVVSVYAVNVLLPLEVLSNDV